MKKPDRVPRFCFFIHPSAFADLSARVRNGLFLGKKPDYTRKAGKKWITQVWPAGKNTFKIGLANSG
jgi:hypothetical protein